MKAQITWEGLRRESDTVSIFDDDNREFCLHRDQIPALIKLLEAIKDRDRGKLPLEIVR